MILAQAIRFGIKPKMRWGFDWIRQCLQSLFYFILFLGQKKIYVCLLSHVKKIKGRSVGIKNFYFLFLLSTKPEIVVPESDFGISFSKFPVK